MDDVVSGLKSCGNFSFNSTQISERGPDGPEEFECHEGRQQLS